MDAPSLEETRMRASQLLSKVHTCTALTHLMSIYVRMLIKWAHSVVVGHTASPALPNLSSPTAPSYLRTSLALHTPPPPPPILIPILTHPSLPSPPPPQVFLQHLSPLLKLGNFQELWLGILGVLEKYCLIKDSDSLVGGGEGRVDH